MKKQGKGTLAERRGEIQDRWLEVKSWREVARQFYPKVKPGTLCAIAKGYEPKSKKILAALDLPILARAPICAKCGVVHSRQCRQVPGWVSAAADWLEKRQKENAR